MTADVVALKRVAAINAGQSPSSDDVADYVSGVPFLQGNAEFGQEHPTPRFECDTAPKRCSPGDVLLSVRAPVGALNVADREYAIGRGLCALSARDCEPRFLWWWLHAQIERLRSVATGSTYESVSADDLGALQFLMIDAKEQQRIADFLDAEISRMASAENGRVREIQMLRRRLTAIIADMYERTGAENGFVRLRHAIASMEQGWSPECESRPAEPGEWGVVKAGCVNGGVFKVDENKALPPDLEPRHRYMLKPGDLLMSRASGSLDLIGSVGIFPGHRSYLMLSDKTYRIRLDRRKMNAEFVAFMLRSARVRSELRLGVSGAGGLANNLPSGVVKNLRLPLVPVDRQPAVVADLSNWQAWTAERVCTLERQINLLRERQQALIAAAVTGQIDVPTARGVEVS